MTGWKHEWWAIELRRRRDELTRLVTKGKVDAELVHRLGDAIDAAFDYIGEQADEITSLNHLVYEIEQHAADTDDDDDDDDIGPDVIDTREVGQRAIGAAAS